MYRTLNRLHQDVLRLIEEQGENAPVAAFIFTKNDVFYYEMDDDGVNLQQLECHLDDEETDEVLTELGGCDYIYEQVAEIIDDEVRRIRIRNKVAS